MVFKNTDLLRVIVIASRLEYRLLSISQKYRIFQALKALGGKDASSIDVAKQVAEMFPNDEGQYRPSALKTEVARKLAKLTEDGYVSCKKGFVYHWTVIKELEGSDTIILKRTGRKTRPVVQMDLMQWMAFEELAPKPVIIARKQLMPWNGMYAPLVR